MSLKHKKYRKQARRAGPISEINVVPYIDVMLVLLVIFMITAPMLTQGVTVELPKAQSQSLNTSEKEPIIVSVDKEGHFYLNITSSPNMPMEAHDLMVRVAAELTLAKEKQEKFQVLVKGDTGVHYGKVVEAMGLLKEAGAEQVGLITDAIKKEGQA